MTCHDPFRQQLIRELRRSYRRNRSILHLYWAMGDLPEYLTLDRVLDDNDIGNSPILLDRKLLELMG